MHYALKHLHISTAFIKQRWFEGFQPKMLLTFAYFKIAKKSVNFRSSLKKSVKLINVLKNE